MRPVFRRAIANAAQHVSVLVAQSCRRLVSHSAICRRSPSCSRLFRSKGFRNCHGRSRRRRQAKSAPKAKAQATTTREIMASPMRRARRACAAVDLREAASRHTDIQSAGRAVEVPGRARNVVADASDDVDRLHGCHAAYVSARNPWSRQRNVCVAWEFGGDCSADQGGVVTGISRPSARRTAR